MNLVRFCFFTLSLLPLSFLCGCGSSESEPSEDSMAAAEAAFDDFEWPESPNGDEVVAGEWALEDGGKLKFFVEPRPKTDQPDFGYKYRATYTAPNGESCEFQWQFLSKSFGTMTDGYDRYFMNDISVQHDDEMQLPWPDSSVEIRFEPGKYEAARLAYSGDSYDPETNMTTFNGTIEIPITRTNDPSGQ
ncbi:MAG: hypothetical protein P8K08_04460 [Fuerstiella sp.]|jgi:hypothetical protein|nr:hypothetical protein [Fuerstiella sp.]